MRSVVLTKRGLFFPDKFSVWILLTLASISLLSFSLRVPVSFDAVTCAVGGGGVCCGCGGEELVGGRFLFELWLGTWIFSFLLEISALSCTGGGGRRCFLPGLQRRTGENSSSEQRSEILRWVF